MIYGLSKKLTLLRQQHKMSQSEVARRIGISSSAVSAFEADDISPSLETLVKLANLYRGVLCQLIIFWMLIIPETRPSLTLPA